MNRQLLPVIHELFADLSGYTIHLQPEPYIQSAAPVSVTTFIELLTADGQRYQLFYLPASLSVGTLTHLLQKASYPVLLFQQVANQVYPTVIKRSGKTFEVYLLDSHSPQRQVVPDLEEFLKTCYTLPDPD